MAFDEQHAQLFRDALREFDGITEKRMFGGLCFLLNGNMVCGVHKSGGMARVGKEMESQALGLEGVDPLSFTGRPMGGMVELNVAALEDASIRDAVVSLATSYVGSLPKK